MIDRVVEKVARAIAEAEEGHEGNWQDYLKHARSVLRVLRSDHN